MNNKPDNSDQSQERPTAEGNTDASSGDAGSRFTLSALPLTAANRSEHIPPIIIKSGSFRIEMDETFMSPTGVFQPPFAYQYRHPFPLRGIRVIASPFGTPETLYFNPAPDNCRVVMVLRTSAGGSLNMNLASVTVGPSRTLVLTTLDHALPTVTTIFHPDRPQRYIYADDNDNSVQLRTITITDAGDQILYQFEATPDTYIGLWRAHQH